MSKGAEIKKQYEERVIAIEAGLKRKRDKEQAVQKEAALTLASQPISLTRYRNAQSIMRSPLFATKHPRNGRQFEPIEFTSSDNSIHIKVTPNTAHGMPDQIDGNILRLTISKAREIKLKTGYTPETVEFSRYKILKALGKTDSSRDYKWLIGALDRLSSTYYSGHIFKKNEHFGATLISYYDSKGNDGVVRVAIKLHAMLRDYIDDDKSVLAIAESIIKAKSNLQIRLHELVQIHIGDKNSWKIGLKKLKKLCASDRQLKHFKADVANSKIPYKIDFLKNRDKDIIVTFQKFGLIANG